MAKDKKGLRSAELICLALTLLYLAGLLGHRWAVSRRSVEAPVVTRLETAVDAMNWKLDINSASEEELDLLPGIGPTLARRIVEYREKYGPFARIEDIIKVYGIGQGRFDAIREEITVGGSGT